MIRARLIVIAAVICMGAVGVSAQSDFLPRGWDSFTASYGFYRIGDRTGLGVTATMGFNGVTDARIGGMYSKSGSSQAASFSTSVTWYPLKTKSKSSVAVGLTTGFQSVNTIDYVTVGVG